MAKGRVVAEIGAVAVPLANGSRVGQNGLLGLYSLIRAENPCAIFVRVVQGFISQDGWCVGLQCKGGSAAEDGIGMEEPCPVQDFLGGAGAKFAGKKVDGE